MSAVPHALTTDQVCPKCGRPWSMIEKSLRFENYGQKYVICPDYHEYKVLDVTGGPGDLTAVGLDPESFREASS